ncbi:hypothetical protein [Plantibacter sp. YIM 135249]|uniref:hypothetical protein n=1 Tax=Plantibacter sp. YIM 135249 TaxID=3423918 RepID=UPI003D33598E
MAKNGVKVKINKFQWGLQVMAGPEMRSFLGGLGSQVASKLPGGDVTVTSSKTKMSGGRRARAIVTSDIPLSVEAEKGIALAALKSVVASAHVQKWYTTKSGKTRRATDAQIANWTRGRP